MLEIFGVPGVEEFVNNREGAQMSCYLHHVPGRIRIKTPYVEGKSANAIELEKRLRAIAGVRLVSANALTGSILVYYDETTTNAGPIVDMVSKETNIDLSTAAHPDQYVDEALSRTGLMVGQKIGKVALGIVIGQLFEGSPLGLLAAVI